MTHDRRRGSTAVTELADEPFIAFGAANSAALIWPVSDISTRAGFAPRVTQAVWQITTAVALAAAGLGNLVWIYSALIRLISGVVFATMKETMGCRCPQMSEGRGVAVLRLLRLRQQPGAEATEGWIAQTIARIDEW